MKLRGLFAAALWFLPLVTLASEFMDDDVLPVQEKLGFDKDKVYFDAHISIPAQEVWYSFDRKTHVLTELDAAPSVMADADLPRVQVDGRCEFHLQTGDGKSYEACLPDCEDEQDGPGSLTDMDTGVVFPAHTPRCLGPGTVERVGDKLLVGSWESGDYSLAEPPVLVLDGKTHALVKSIDFAADVIRADPDAPQVWLVGAEGAMLLDGDLSPKQRWYFYRGFDPVGHASRLLVSDTPRKSDAFAAIAWSLHVTDAEGWYRTVQGLPADTRQRVDMYGYFMGMVQFDDPKYPGLQTLIPYIIDPMRLHLGDYAYERQFASICQYPDPRVDALVDAMIKSSNLGTSRSGAWCAERRAKSKPTAK